MSYFDINLLSFNLDLEQSFFCCFFASHPNLLNLFSIESFCFQSFIINFIKIIALKIEKYLVCFSKWSSPILNISFFFHCRFKILLIEQARFFIAIIKSTIFSYIYPAYIIIQERGRKLIFFNSVYHSISFGLQILLNH